MVTKTKQSALEAYRQGLERWAWIHLAKSAGFVLAFFSTVWILIWFLKNNFPLG